MNYIEDENFKNNELIPLIDSMINTYLNDEVKYAESLSEIENIMYDNCPEDLKYDILVEVNDLITQCVDDYDIIEWKEDEYENMLNLIIDNEFEKCKTDIIDIEMDSFEKENFFDEYEEDIDFWKQNT